MKQSHIVAIPHLKAILFEQDRFFAFSSIILAILP